MTEPRPDLKEFLYVDVDRVRSLLSQLAGGFIEQIRSSTGSNLSGGAQAMIFGVGAKGDRTVSSQYEEARSLQDLTFAAFESLANENGYVSDLTPEYMEAEKWADGTIQTKLLPGQLIRASCAVQLLDAGFFRSRVERILKLAEALVEMDSPGSPSRSSSPSKRADANKGADKQRAAKLAEMIGMPLGQFIAISDAVEAFSGDSVLVRLFPCGTDYPEFAFTGSLLGRSEYIQAERENLFSRYGQIPTRWTTVFQVAAVPQRIESVAEDVSKLPTTGADGQVIRSNMEKIAANLLSTMEQIGIVEGARWPAVSITPLGLYRPVPQTSLLT